MVHFWTSLSLSWFSSSLILILSHVFLCLCSQVLPYLEFFFDWRGIFSPCSGYLEIWVWWFWYTLIIGVLLYASGITGNCFRNQQFFMWTASTILGWVHKVREYMTLKCCFLFALCYISNRFWRIPWLDTHLITCGCSCLCHTFGDCICLFSGCSLWSLAQRENLLEHLPAMKGKSGCSFASHIHY